MARSAPEVDTFVKRYANYIEQQIAPSYDRLSELLEEFRSEEFWAKQAERIYRPDTERDNPAHHPVPSPIYHTKTRIKFVDTAMRKLVNEPKYGGFNKDALQKLEDVLAARIVVFFPHQLKWIDDVLRRSPVLKISGKMPPKSFHDAATLERLGLSADAFDARNRKQSGYSSLHYIVRFTKGGLPDAPHPWFEIQVRTIAEELWGEIEHHIGYKPERRTAFSVQRQFRVISEHLQAVDLHLDFIYDEMQHYQSGEVPKDDDILNAENLPTVLSALQIRVVQHELGPVSDLLALFEIRTVAELNQRAPYDCLEQVRAAWKQHLDGDQAPNALMILNVLASFTEPPTQDAIELRVASYYELYRSLRGGPLG